MADFRHGEARDGGDGGIRIGARLKVNLNHADAGERARLHMIDAAGQREEALQVIGDVAFDLLRRHPGIERRDCDHRDVHRRKEIDRHPRHADDTDERDRPGR